LIYDGSFAIHVGNAIGSFDVIVSLAMGLMSQNWSSILKFLFMGFEYSALKRWNWVPWNVGFNFESLLGS
jgi:hypothetical protein